MLHLDRAARVTLAVPFRHGRAVIDAQLPLVHEDGNERRSDALSLRPANLRRVLFEAFGVALSDDLPFVNDDERPA